MSMHSVSADLLLDLLLLTAVVVCFYAGLRAKRRRNRLLLIAWGSLLACAAANLLIAMPIRTNQRLGLVLFGMCFLGQGTAWMVFRERITKPAVVGGGLLLAGSLVLAAYS